MREGGRGLSGAGACLDFISDLNLISVSLQGNMSETGLCTWLSLSLALCPFFIYRYIYTLYVSRSPSLSICIYKYCMSLALRIYLYIYCMSLALRLSLYLYIYCRSLALYLPLSSYLSQADQQTDWQVNRRTGRQIGRPTDRPTERQAGRQVIFCLGSGQAGWFCSAANDDISSAQWLNGPYFNYLKSKYQNTKRK